MPTVQKREYESGKMLFPPVVVTEMFNKVKGHSSLAKLCAQSPIAFNGQTEFTFSLDKEVDIVAEGAKKGVGGVTVLPITIIPIKFEYGARVSDEFVYGSDEVKLEYMRNFADGFAAKLARGLDIAAFHGLNPRTSTASVVVGDNCFDKAVKTTVEYAAETADDNLEDAIGKVNDADGTVTGIAISPAFGTAISKIKVNGVRQYPEFAFGRNPGVFAGMPTDVNSTVSVKAAEGETDHAIVGDFARAFKWGYAKEIPVEVIRYGNPDNDAEAGDLKGSNQVYLRAEAYIGWGILDPTSFARITAASEAV